MTNPEMLTLNQYSLPAGLGTLQQAVCDFYNRTYNLSGTRGEYTPANVAVVAGATEGLDVAINTVVGEGDEVIMFDPSFPWYAGIIRMAGATPVILDMAPPKFMPDLDAVRAAITPRTKALLLNSPHNPCGHCYTQEELEALAGLAVAHDLTVISDEVYENVVFAGRRHLRIADQEGMAERTLTLGSASKLLSLTGWRVGWVLGHERYMAGVRTLHAATSYCAPTPLQHGVAAALQAEDGAFEGRPATIEANAAVLGAALREAGFAVCPADGGHFLTADTSPLGLGGLAATRQLLGQEDVRVGAVPSMIFYAAEGGAGGEEEEDRPLVRFALCKERATVEEAAERIRRFRPVLPPPS